MTKKGKKQQKVIAEEVAEQQEVRKLRRQIKLLKRLPEDFRDIDPGSPDWEAFAEATGRRKEMEAWSNGPIYCFAEPNKLEQLVFGQQEIRQLAISQWPWNGLAVLTHIEHNKGSWFYLPDEEPKVVSALNILLSRLEYKFRARGRLLSERTGHPLGVVQ